MKKKNFDKSNMILIIEEKGIMEDLFEQKKVIINNTILKICFGSNK